MSADRPYQVNLTVTETLLLDGKADPETQKIVDRAKEDLAVQVGMDGASPAVRTFVADAVREAREHGQLVFRPMSLTYGQYSGRKEGYWTYSRSRGIHRKGDLDYSRPRHFAGFDLAQRFIRVQGHAVLGDSLEFLEEARPFLLKALKDVPAELPEKLTGEPPRWKRYDKAHCSACGWVGHEGEMGRSRCVLEGTYPSTCPKCGARNGLFQDATIKTGGDLGFVVVPVEAKP